MTRQPPGEQAASRAGIDPGGVRCASADVAQSRFSAFRAWLPWLDHRHRLGLRALQRQLLRVYRRIDEHIEAGKAGIRAEEWLVDNRHIVQDAVAQRSEERRVGKECVRTFRSRWSPVH